MESNRIIYYLLCIGYRYVCTCARVVITAVFNRETKRNKTRPIQTLAVCMVCAKCESCACVYIHTVFIRIFCINGNSGRNEGTYITAAGPQRYGSAKPVCPRKKTSLLAKHSISYTHTVHTHTHTYIIYVVCVNLHDVYYTAVCRLNVQRL